jgi:hypothetical protein
LGYNVQNLLILYLLNLLCLAQWAKIIFKEFFNTVYSWFYVQYDDKLSVTFILELWSVLVNYLNLNSFSLKISTLNISNFLYSTNELLMWKYI